MERTLKSRCTKHTVECSSRAKSVKWTRGWRTFNLGSATRLLETSLSSNLERELREEILWEGQKIDEEFRK